MNVEEIDWRKEREEGRKEMDGQEGLCKCGSKVVGWDGVDKTELLGGKEEKQKEKELFLFSSSGPWWHKMSSPSSKHIHGTQSEGGHTHTHTISHPASERTQIHTLLFSTP